MDIPQKKLAIAKYFKIFFTGILLLLLSFAPNIGVSVENNTTTNSLSFRNKPFNEVVDILCNQYNVEIFYDKALAIHSISGEYVNVSLKNMLERMLKGKNISILTHSENNTIDIRFFGERNTRLVESAGFQSKSKFTDSVDPFTQKTIAQLSTISEQQEKSKTARLKSPNYIDPFSGIRLDNLNTILQLQEKNKAKRLNNPNAIDPLTGLTMSTLNNVLKIQAENKNTRLGI